ncbi:hypothetical protein HanRHA438_Chr12g0572611 [Helianthus annuus]|uniref:Uncharacterized protein n=2 Tax=Helianthus annuus TaxID=4232 RepID=A0A9K3HJZ2_HELAN|nr:hypothetical protein HanXRQr2_Chr12g0561331 [Helianthus annuus]KAJ0490857.1 hypothetical protein HanHA300_Chr12g0460391 [Helianthus annuus]KAJ0495183.1 hypothetical protein HanIR_Chr12g0606031 [Helianthus annuus]KAJ0506761.1 hypothetical protein HanHA89_Chr12g0485801 [Helianthus annuus]KAJ0676440.1 hypothetical protein HanLR1_Chr12g0462821 [Helianthus annuus]
MLSTTLILSPQLTLPLSLSTNFTLYPLPPFMAESQSKRLREDDVVSTTETTKRHRNTYINDQQETTTTQELLDFFTSLSSDPFLVFAPQPEPDPDANNNNNNINDDEKESVIRHLLEASDDELGIPRRADDDVSGGGGGVDDDVTGGGCDMVDLCDGLWELEDEAANYYTLLQSELFMQ